ncbi:MAG: WD40 repeat domain-containing protein [Patescibacteria group bacterium]
MFTIKWLFKPCLISCLFWLFFSNAAQAKYQDYTYTYSDTDPDTMDSNYHYDNLAISADGSIAAAIGGLDVTADQDMVVFKDNKATPDWGYSVGENGSMFDLALSADSSTIMACGSDIWVYDVSAKTLLWKYSNNNYAYDVCAVSSDGNYLAAGDRGGMVTLWERGSKTPVRTWQLAEPGYFVNSVTMTKDGQHILASTDFTTAYIDTQSDKMLWTRNSATEIIAAGCNASDCTYGYLLRDDSNLANGGYKLTGFKVDTASTLWQKDVASDNTPRVALSGTGKRLVLTTNTGYYGYNMITGRQKWKYLRSGGETEVALSDTGKWIIISDGHEYVYVFDWGYPHSTQRPIRMIAMNFPGSVAISSYGETIVYEHNAFTLKDLPPSLLVKTRGVPVYARELPVNMEYFVSNPGGNKNLRIKTTLSLPQVAILSDLEQTVDGEPQGVKGKLLEYTNATLPGYAVGEENREVDQNAHSSEKVYASFTMPDLLMPDWVGDLLEFLGLDDLFDNMFGQFSTPMNLLLNAKLTAEMTAKSDSQAAEGGLYPLFGLGETQLYDASTNEVYDIDRFFFIYIAF